MITKKVQGCGERILLVEDEETFRRFAKIVLETNGYHVVEAASSEEALDIFEKENGRFNLVFSDVVLPGKNGIQLVKQLFAMHSDLKVLMSSGYNKEMMRLSTKDKKNVRFIAKPFGVDGLLSAVNELLP